MLRMSDQRRSSSWLSLTVHAMAETWADCRHDMRTTGSLLRRLGSVAGLLAACARILGGAVWTIDGPSPFGSLGQDLRAGLRRLRRAPVFAIFSIATLAIGIGGTTAVYSLIQAVIGTPRGVPTIDRLVTVTVLGSGALQRLSAPDFQDYWRAQKSFERLSGWSSSRFALTTDTRAETSLGEIVTGDYFETLGLTASVGRLIQRSDDQPAATPAVVISDVAWRKLFDADPTVGGHVLLVNGQTFTIVGVTPASFKGMTSNGLIPAIAWIPSAKAPLVDPGSVHLQDDRTLARLWVLGLLRPDVTIASAQAEAKGVAAELDQGVPLSEVPVDGDRSNNPMLRSWTLSPVQSRAGGDGGSRTIVEVLMTSVLIVLMVACTNLTNLLLARGADRQRDLAVRSALGASRWRLTREALVEAGVLAGAGALASLLLARLLMLWLTRDVVLHGAGTVHLEPSLDAAALVMTGGATTLALFVIGVVPSWRSSRTDVQPVIASGGHAGALLRWRGRRALIVCQVAVSLVLILLAGLCASNVALFARQDGDSISSDWRCSTSISISSTSGGDERRRMRTPSWIGSRACRVLTVPRLRPACPSDLTLPTFTFDQTDRLR